MGCCIQEFDNTRPSHILIQNNEYICYSQATAPDPNNSRGQGEIRTKFGLVWMPELGTKYISGKHKLVASIFVHTLLLFEATGHGCLPPIRRIYPYNCSWRLSLPRCTTTRENLQNPISMSRQVTKPMGRKDHCLAAPEFAKTFEKVMFGRRIQAC
jgi:hypothetical protein